MNRNRIIIIEGPQGTGKTTLANYLRDNISGSNLYRLSGQKDKTIQGLKYSTLMYNALSEYLQKMQHVPMDLIFDRTFMSEEVYARLGYKDYLFTDNYNEYAKQLNALNYDIYYFSLFLKDVELYRKRLARESHHNYQAFSLQSSVNQQNKYLEIADELSNFNNINVIKLEMDNFEVAYDKVREILNLRKNDK